MVNIDTGVIYFNGELVKKWLALISDSTGKINKRKFQKFVNDKSQISLYNDFIYVFSKKATLCDYLKEKPEGSFCKELTKCREEIWKNFSQYHIKIIETYPSKFIHLGTTKELIDMLKQNKGNHEYHAKKSILSNKRRGYSIYS